MIRKVIHVPLIAFTLVLNMPISSAQGIYLDPTFGNGGIVSTDCQNSIDRCNGMAVQVDGKIVLAGTTDSSGHGCLFLARYTTDGILDTTFGITGKLKLSLVNDIAGYTVAIQNDGKIVVGGMRFENAAIGNVFFLTRFDSTGIWDTTFGNGGYVKYVLFSNQASMIKKIVIQPDNKIVAAVFGKTFSLGSSEYLITRCLVDGTLDPDFGTGGITVTDFSGASDNVTDLALLPDGRIIASGMSVQSPGLSDYFVSMACYDSTGILDTSFGSGGKATVYVNEGGSYSMTIKNNKILLAGYANASTVSSEVMLCRFHLNGTPDNTFGTGGLVTVPSAYHEYACALAVKIQDDNRIVTAGNFYDFNYTINDYLIRRFEDDGSIDSSFGQAGAIYTDFSGYRDEAYGLYIQPDGKIIACGQAFMTATNIDFSLARYDSAGSVSSESLPGYQSLPVVLQSKTDIVINLQEKASEAKVELYDMQSHLLKNKKITLSTNFSIEELPPGLYLIQLIGKNYRVVKKIIKQ